MKILSSTLSPEIERWHDPGDYPNGAASAPLPSAYYVSEISGELVIALGVDELRDIASGQDVDTSFQCALGHWINQDPGVVPHGLTGIIVRAWDPEWDVSEGKAGLHLSVHAFDAGEYERAFNDDRGAY